MRRKGGGPVLRSGAVLLLVVFYIVLASSLTVLVTASSVQLLQTGRQKHESILLRQLADSARAWVQAHGGLHADTPVTLSAGDILLEGISGNVRISIDADSPDVVVIDARLSLSGRKLTRTTRFTGPH